MDDQPVLSPTSDDLAAHSTAKPEPDLDRQTQGQAPSWDVNWAADWGQLLRTARQIAGLSLTQLSAVTNLSKGYLSKLESGSSGAANPSRATLAALARALPSFRPLAHTLEPGMGTAELDYSGLVPARYDDHVDTAEAEPAPALIQLGWRELEVYVALVTLEAAAIPLRITAAVLARATGRDAAAIKQTMDLLIRQELAEIELPARAGDVAIYRCAGDGLARVGVTRLGELLMLAAALLAGAPRHHPSPRAVPHRAGDRTPGGASGHDERIGGPRGYAHGGTGEADG